MLVGHPAESWLDAFEGDATTEAINSALADALPDHEFTDVAAARLGENDLS